MPIRYIMLATIVSCAVSKFGPSHGSRVSRTSFPIFGSLDVASCMCRPKPQTFTTAIHLATTDVEGRGNVQITTIVVWTMAAIYTTIQILPDDGTRLERFKPTTARLANTRVVCQFIKICMSRRVFSNRQRTIIPRKSFQDETPDAQAY